MEETEKPKTVMVFGTFDIIHPGHLNLFEQAKEAAGPDSRLVVVVARDMNAKKAKGIFPLNNENIRLSNVKKKGAADEVILGELGDMFKVIERTNPDIICLGYDQKVSRDFEPELRKRGIKAEIKRMKPYKSNAYKSSILKDL